MPDELKIGDRVRYVGGLDPDDRGTVVRYDPAYHQRTQVMVILPHVYVEYDSGEACWTMTEKLEKIDE